jgi:hypothetical protein
MNRTIKDAALIVTKALPAAAASASSDSILLGTSIVEGQQVLLTVPATPALVDDKTITYTFEDSANDASFTAIPQLATKVSTGAGGVGAAAVEHRVCLPPTTRKYLRVTAAVLTAGGNNTGVSFTLTLLPS